MDEKTNVKKIIWFELGLISCVIIVGIIDLLNFDNKIVSKFNNISYWDLS